MTSIALAVVSLALMEPFVAVVHRRTMHGWAWAWHRSHHRRPPGPFEANDLFPLVFAVATVAAMAAGTYVDGLSVLVAVGTGVTAYGALYLVVHDLYIHARLGRLPGADTRYIRWVAEAHAVHHATAREPFGFLVPLVPHPAAGLDGDTDRPRASVLAGRGEELAIPRPRRTGESDA